MALKSYASVGKGLKLKGRKCWGLTPMVVEVTGGKLVGGASCPPTLMQNRFNLKLKLRNTYTFAQHENSKM